MISRFYASKWIMGRYSSYRLIGDPPFKEGIHQFFTKAEKNEW